MPEQAHVNNPYIDFKFGDHYASDFHLLRVSDGNRFNSNIIPTLTDKTTEIPGADGMYFFNTYYKQRQFTINFAYEAVTEEDIRNIRKWLNGKEVQSLIFDEEPDRQYCAKVTGSPTLKYIAFDELETVLLPSNTTEEDIEETNTETASTTHVVFKGEGTVQFTCYDPYAYALSTTKQTYAQSNGIWGYNITPLEVKGTAPSTFKVTSDGTVNADTVITIKDSNNVALYTITLKEDATNKLTWDSATGMVKSATKPIHYIGQGMGTLPVGGKFHVHPDPDVALTFEFKDRYI